MTNSSLKGFIFPLLLAAVTALPILADAQVFRYNHSGTEICAGFRKTGQFADPYEAVANLGSFTNFLSLSPGTTATMSRVSPAQLKDCFADGFSNLQWSAWGYISDISGAFGTYSNDTLFFTVPNGTNVNSQTTPPLRGTASDQGTIDSVESACEQGAFLISGYLIVSNQDNTPYFVREAVTTYSNYKLSAYIGDVNNVSIGDFGSGYNGFSFNIENVTPKNFLSPQRSDLYLSVPASTDINSGNSINLYIDPLTGLTNGPADFLGYFIFNTNGLLTFTRAFAVNATATNGSIPLKVVFNTTATNSAGATNWVWNFGDGNSIISTNASSVTNTYTIAGTYTVTLTINGTNGSVTLTLPNYVVTSSSVASIPGFSKIALSGSSLIVSGTNGTATTSYRVLMSTNLMAGNWVPVFTNTFSGTGTFSYTNTTTGTSGFFRVVSP